MTDTLYRHNGGIPAALPYAAFDAKGDHWTDLAGSPEGRAACGYVEAPAAPDFDPTTHAVRWDEAAEVWKVDALPPPPPAPEPRPRPLTRLAFVTLVQQAGGMSPALYLQARRDEAFAYLWDMLNFAEEVARDDELTAQALGSLAAGGYLPNGVDAVRGAWPAV